MCRAHVFEFVSTKYPKIIALQEIKEHAQWKKKSQRRNLVTVTSNKCCQWHVNTMTREHEQKQQQKLTFLMRRPKINQHPVQKMVQITASAAQMQQKIISKLSLALLSQLMSLQLQMYPWIYYMWYRLKVKGKGTCTWFWGIWGTRSTFRRKKRGTTWNSWY